ncbi:MAG: lactate utilization protein [Treponema sp.]|jgi:L-lactate utilization protein LutB|nr:lactate utilization protein [Treponema sp.]
MSTPISLRNQKLGAKTVQALKNRFFDAWYFDEPAEALEKIMSLIPADHTVSWGGSFTLDELGIKERLAEKGYKLLDRDKALNPEERAEIMRQALLCGTFLTGCNAISEDGQLVNIDGFGNRVAAMIFGPRQVIVIAGMNKVAKTLDDAIIRARTIAAPRNTQRFQNNKTPCNETGSCANCTSPDSICSFIVTTRLCKPANRIKVILVGKDMGL